jgi:hypothetical protein
MKITNAFAILCLSSAAVFWVGCNTDGSPGSPSVTGRSFYEKTKPGDMVVNGAPVKVRYYDRDIDELPPFTENREVYLHELIPRIFGGVSPGPEYFIHIGETKDSKLYAKYPETIPDEYLLPVDPVQGLASPPEMKIRYFVLCKSFILGDLWPAGSYSFAYANMDGQIRICEIVPFGEIGETVPGDLVLEYKKGWNVFRDITIATDTVKNIVNVTDTVNPSELTWLVERP